MGFCLSHTSKIKLLDLIGNHFADNAIKQVRLGKNIHGTGDNWDMKIRPHDMLSTHQNTDLHYFACDNLSKAAPQRDINSLSNSTFLLDEVEAVKLREDLKVLVGRILVKNMPQLSFLKWIIPEHIPHKYQREMAQRSIIVSLPMMMKDEKKYGVDILDGYEQQLEEIFIKAGVIQKPEEHQSVEPPCITSGQSSTADQARGHINKDDENDYMKEVSVPFGGDQMTRVRFAGAKDLRAGAHTLKQRFLCCIKKMYVTICIKNV